MMSRCGYRIQFLKGSWSSCSLHIILLIMRLPTTGLINLMINVHLGFRIQLKLPFLCTIKSKPKWFFLLNQCRKWLQHQISVFCSISLKSVDILLSFMQSLNSAKAHTVFWPPLLFTLFYSSLFPFSDWSAIRHKSRVWHSPKEVKGVLRLFLLFFYRC